MTSYCFVIQPFDGGKFDRRYKEVFAPAIESAGLEPYRVDQDPNVRIPIDQIMEGIERSALCLADITLDNPNVWFEVGYALAAGKDICLVCASSRSERYPFDVQHRKIIRYDSDSPSDFESLRNSISESLKASVKRKENLTAISSQLPLKSDAGLTQHEIMVLASIMECVDGPSSWVSHWSIKRALEEQGFNNLGLNLGLARLLQKSFINTKEESDRNGDTYIMYAIENSGRDWLLENVQLLDLSPKKTSTDRNDLSDEIPF
jgi:hypothetical protein